MLVKIATFPCDSVLYREQGESFADTSVLAGEQNEQERRL
jgi:hypothetical protein